MPREIQEFLENISTWKKEILLLRDAIKNINLKETIKWGSLCYTFNGKNVFVIGLFKSYFSISFFKGVLIEDKDNILISPGEDSHHVRMLIFTSSEEVKSKRSVINDFIDKAIKIEEQGLKVTVSDRSLRYPVELTQAFTSSSEFKRAFEKLTPGRKRAYILFFTKAKQSETRSDRIQKYRGRILNGFGINDCVCGKSKKMPRCDGSHSKQ